MFRYAVAGPVAGTVTVRGKPFAVARKRSTRRPTFQQLLEFSGHRKIRRRHR